MIRSLYTAATGMSAQQTNVDNISNNIANLSTNSYKRGMVNFEDLMYQSQTIAGANSSNAGTTLPSENQIGLGTKVSSIYKSFEQGSIASTPGVELNVAMDGEGFFQVTLPNGDIAYTRDGAFQKDKDGQIVNSLGYVVVPGITIPDNATNLTITTDGKIQVTVNSVVQEIGQFQLVRFINPAGLRATGGNMYLKTDGSGDPIEGFATDDGYGSVKQFFLEQSNVNSVFEISQLVIAQRAFEFNSKVIQTSEQMAKTVVDAKA
jgi:flagellar basal-body rod protein FlgG